MSAAPLLPSSTPATYGTIESSSPGPENGSLLPASDADLPAIPTGDHLTLDQLLETFGVSRSLTARQAALVLVACLRRLQEVSVLKERVKGKSTKETWEARESCRKAAERLERVILEVWELWVGEGEKDEEEGGGVEVLLWSSVTSGRDARVVDFMSKPFMPRSLVDHPLVQFSLTATWRKGMQKHLSAPPSSTAGQIIHFVDSFATPRLLHAHSLILHLLHLSLALRLSLFPAPIDLPRWGPWEILWAIWTVGAICDVPRRFSLFGVLSGLALVLALPSPPAPHSLAFQLLLGSVTIGIVGLHLPWPPTPVLLFPMDVVEMSTFLQKLVIRALLPSFAFIFPVSLLAIVALAVSLNGEPWHPYVDAAFFVQEVSPYETRVAILAILFLSLAAYVWLAVALTIQVASQAHGEQETGVSATSQEARRAFLQANAAYAFIPASQGETQYRFPSPINVISIGIIDIPYTIMAMIPRLQTSAATYRRVGTAMLWRITVAPVVMALSAVWAWESLASFPVWLSWLGL